MALPGEPDNVDNKGDTNTDEVAESQAIEKGLGLVVEADAADPKDDELGQPGHKDGKGVAATCRVRSHSSKSDWVEWKTWECITQDESDTNSDEADQRPEHMSALELERISNVTSGPIKDTLDKTAVNAAVIERTR